MSIVMLQHLHSTEQCFLPHLLHPYNSHLYSGVLITLENCLLPDDKLRFTPSMSSGLDTDTETDLRVVGCELIQAAGILLRLPQVRELPRASGRGNRRARSAKAARPFVGGGAGIGPGARFVSLPGIRAQQ